MLLNSYGMPTTPKQVITSLPVKVDAEGTEIGSLSQELATWAISLGYEVTIHSFDVQITDMSWIGMDEQMLLERLKAVEEIRNVPNLGKESSKRYVRSYVNFIKNGGKLIIAQYPTIDKIVELLQISPLFVNVCAHTLYGIGRLSYLEPGKNKPDDVNGKITTHSIVVHEYDGKGTFTIADPWEGRKEVSAEALLSGITATQIECDNMIIQLAAKG